MPTELAIPRPEWTPGPSEYHSTDRWSSSKLRAWLKSPALYFGRYIEGSIPRKTSGPMDIGTAVGLRLLGGGGEVIVSRVASRRGTAWEESVTAAGPDDVVLTKQQGEQVADILAGIARDPSPAAQRCREWLTRARDELGTTEYAYAWTRDGTPDTGMQVRFDALLPQGPDRALVLDLKSTRRDGPEGYVRDVIDFGYDVQAALYREGAAHLLDIDIDDVDVCHVVYSTSPPYYLAHFSLAQFLDEGAEKVDRALTGLLRSKKTDEWWPDWQNSATAPELSAPSWYQARQAEALNKALQGAFGSDEEGDE